jgi:hypothetical protein
VVRPFAPRILFDIGVVWPAGRIRSALALGFAEKVRLAIEAFARADAPVLDGPA